MVLGALLAGGGFFTYGFARSIAAFYGIAAVVALGAAALTVIPLSAMVSRKAGLYDGRGVCRRWGGVLCMDAGGEPAVGGPRAGLDLSFPRVGYAGRRPAAEPVLRFYAKRSARGAAGAERKGAGD